MRRPAIFSLRSCEFFDDDCKYARRIQRFNRQYKKRKLAGAEDAHLPLHMANPPKMDYAEIEAILREIGNAEVREELTKLWKKYLPLATDEKPYIDACKGAADTNIGNANTNISAADHQLMLDAEYSEECPHYERLGRIFARVEEKKSRRRQLYWPKQLNDELTAFFAKYFEEGKAPCELKDAAEHATGIRVRTVARCYDLTKSFLQLQLAKCVRKYYGYIFEGKKFQCRTAPMGCVWVPGFMELILKILSYNEVAGVDTDTHIDNVRFHGDPRGVDEAAERFVKNCARCNATLNEEAVNQRHDLGTFVGAEHDYSQAKVRLSEKTVDKIREAKAYLSDPAATIEDFRELFGLLFYASRVLRIGLAEFYAPIKFLRRRMHEVAKGRMSEESRAELWPSVRSDLERWIEATEQNEWTRHLPHQERNDLVIVTDASLRGWGAVMYDEATSKVAAAGESWPTTYTSNQINELEAAAVRKAVVAFAERIKAANPKQILLLLDNTATVFSLRKGSSQSWALNQEVKKALTAMPEDVAVKVAYIHTKENEKFADPISRGKGVSELASQLGEVGRRLARTAFQVSVPRSCSFHFRKDTSTTRVKG